MDIKAFLKDIPSNFFAVYSYFMLGHIIIWRIRGVESLSWYNLTAYFIMSFLFSLTTIVFYTNRNLKRFELLIRYILHLILCVVVFSSVSSYMGWIRWDEPMYFIIVTGLFVFIYTTVLATRLYQSKKQADEMNEMLKEINEQ